MNLLITGGAGFIGSHFTDYALSVLGPTSEVRVFDNLTYAGNLANLEQAKSDKRFKFVKGDISKLEDVEKVINGVTHVVNFAAESHVDRSIKDSYIFVKTNIIGTHILLEQSRINGIQKFLQISTDEVYGSINIGSWDENSPLNPNSPYAASKASADLLVRSYHVTHNMNVNVTRSSNNYGARQFPEKIIPLFIQKLFSGQKIPIYGDGKNQRDWLHVSDHCQAIWKVLINGVNGETYNVGSGNELTNEELASRLINLIPNATPDQISYVEDRRGHDFRYSVDFTKLSDELDFSPKMDFNIGLKETVNWYINRMSNLRSQPNGNQNL